MSIFKLSLSVKILMLFVVMFILAGCYDECCDYYSNYENNYITEFAPEAGADSVSVFPVFRIKRKNINTNQHYFYLDTSNPPFLDSPNDIWSDVDSIYIAEIQLKNNTQYYWEYAALDDDNYNEIRYYTDIHTFTTCSKDGVPPEVWFNSPSSEADTIYGLVDLDIGVFDENGHGYIEVHCNDEIVRQIYNNQPTSASWNVFIHPPGKKDLLIKCWDNTGEYAELQREIVFNRCIYFQKQLFDSRVDVEVSNIDSFFIDTNVESKYYPVGFYQNSFNVTWRTCGIKSENGRLGSDIEISERLNLSDRNYTYLFNIPENMMKIMMWNNSSYRHFIIKGYRGNPEYLVTEDRFEYDYSNEWNSIAFYKTNNYSRIEISACEDSTYVPVFTDTENCASNYSNRMYYKFEDVE